MLFIYFAITIHPINFTHVQMLNWEEIETHTRNNLVPNVNRWKLIDLTLTPKIDILTHIFFLMKMHF